MLLTKGGALLPSLSALLCVATVVVGDAQPDLANHINEDPENPDFSGVVDFSNAVPGPDNSWCITKVKYVDHMESDQVKECWHQNVTQCHDSYITEFFPSQEQKCEESYWKSCKIDFKEVPFNYSLKQCHKPLIKQCDDFGSQSDYGPPAKTVCRTWFESECNTTFVQKRNGDTKPNTWCQKMPRKICAPDNCNMIQGAEKCQDRTMVSTIQKPQELCELQPQRNCRLITKLVPHLTTKEVCREIPKEICVLKLVNPHTVKKPVQLKWCTKTPPKKVQEQPVYRPAPSSYLPAPADQPPPPPPTFQAIPPPPSYESFSAPSQYTPIGRREGEVSLLQEEARGGNAEQFILTIDDEPQEFSEFPTQFREQFRQVREVENNNNNDNDDDQGPATNRVVIRRKESPGMNKLQSPGMNKLQSPGMNKLQSPGMNKLQSPGMNKLHPQLKEPHPRLRAVHTRKPPRPHKTYHGRPNYLPSPVVRHSDMSTSASNNHITLAGKNPNTLITLADVEKGGGSTESTTTTQATSTSSSAPPTSSTSTASSTKPSPSPSDSSATESSPSSAKMPELAVPTEYTAGQTSKNYQKTTKTTKKYRPSTTEDYSPPPALNVYVPPARRPTQPTQLSSSLRNYPGSIL